MFTGIIRHIGTVKEIATDDATSVVIAMDVLPEQVELGSSIAVNGVCLTVAALKDNEITFDIMPVTLEKTALQELGEGNAVNLELSLRAGDEIGGHFVYGHVDCIGEIRNVKSEMEETVLLEVAIPVDWITYMVPQGSIAIDGVSLTIASMTDTTVTVSLVSYTQEHTTLGKKQIGDRVNIEADMLAKYVVGKR